MNAERLTRLHRLRRATTDRKAVAVAQEQVRVGEARLAESRGVAAREQMRAALAEGSRQGGAIATADLNDRHAGAEHGVRAAVRLARHVVEAERLLDGARADVRVAWTEEQRIEVLLTAQRERHRAETQRLDGLEHDELATVRHRRPAPGAGPDDEGGEDA